MKNLCKNGYGVFGVQFFCVWEFDIVVFIFEEFCCCIWLIVWVRFWLYVNELISWVFIFVNVVFFVLFIQGVYSYNMRQDCNRINSKKYVLSKFFFFFNVRLK